MIFIRDFICSTDINNNGKNNKGSFLETGKTVLLTGSKKNNIRKQANGFKWKRYTAEGYLYVHCNTGIMNLMKHALSVLELEGAF